MRIVAQSFRTFAMIACWFLMPLAIRLPLQPLYRDRGQGGQERGASATPSRPASKRLPLLPEGWTPWPAAVRARAKNGPFGGHARPVCATEALRTG